MKNSEKYSSFYRLRVNPWVSMFTALLICLVISPLITQGIFTLYPSVSAGDHPLFSSARLLLPSALTITVILVWARTMDKLSLKDSGPDAEESVCILGDWFPVRGRTYCSGISRADPVGSLSPLMGRCIFCYPHSLRCSCVRRTRTI